MVGEAKDLFGCAEAISGDLPLIDEVATKSSSYYSGTVNTESIVYWLLQFSDVRTIRCALRLLRHLDFVDENRLARLLKTAFDQVPKDVRENAFIANIGKGYDSSAPVGYSFAKTIGLEEEQLAARWLDSSQIGSKSGPLLLIDDNLASGTQLERYLSEMFPDHEGNREHFKEPLPAEQIESLQKDSISALIAVELGPGKSRVQEYAATKGLDLRIYFGASDSCQWLVSLR